jgi:hypothetical protein
MSRFKALAQWLSPFHSARFPDEREETPEERALVSACWEQIRGALIDAVGTDRCRLWAVRGRPNTFHCWMEEGNDVIIRLEHGYCYVEAIVPNAYEQKRRGGTRR